MDATEQPAIRDVSRVSTSTSSFFCSRVRPSISSTRIIGMVSSFDNRFQEISAPPERRQIQCYYSEIIQPAQNHCAGKNPGARITDGNKIAAHLAEGCSSVVEAGCGRRECCPEIQTGSHQ